MTLVLLLLLDPSLFGWLAPALFARLFPPALNALSQIGLVLFIALFSTMVAMALALKAMSVWWREL